jgi:hypothetical protein
MIEVENYKGYFITETGKVWSSKTNRFLKTFVNRKGYLLVKLVNSREDQKTISVHRLVAQHYLTERGSGTQVNHIDGNKLNNSKGNLEWISCLDNVRHSWAIGLHTNDLRKGTNNKQSKLNDEAVLDIRLRLQNGEKLKEIACDYRVDISLISLIKRNKIWQHV